METDLSPVNPVSPLPGLFRHGSVLMRAVRLTEAQEWAGVTYEPGDWQIWAMRSSGRIRASQ